MSTIQVVSPNGQKLTLFYVAKSPFSNFHTSPFAQNSEADPEIKNFRCTEQYFMYNKALTFGDGEAAKKILVATAPGTMKALGRSVQNFDKAVWDEKSSYIMKKGLLAKFSQSQNLRRSLFLTHGSWIAEASPTDRIWGIGLNVMDTKARDPKLWRGKNLLGKLLEEVRDELWEDERFKDEVEAVKKLIDADPTANFFQR